MRCSRLRGRYEFGEPRCTAEATHRLTVTVDDRGSEFSHGYCRKHAKEAQGSVFLAAASAGRAGVVRSRIDPIPATPDPEAADG